MFCDRTTTYNILGGRKEELGLSLVFFNLFKKMKYQNLCYVLKYERGTPYVV